MEFTEQADWPNNIPYLVRTLERYDTCLAYFPDINAAISFIDIKWRADTKSRIGGGVR